MRRVLIIEDSDTDALLFQEAIHDCGMEIIVNIVSCWVQAECMLSDPGLSLIMLDLNLPGVGGRDMINLIRVGKGLSVPILVFSTSSSPSDIHACYKEGANGYIIKPYDVDDLFQTMCSTFKWWLDVNKLWEEVYD